MTDKEHNPLNELKWFFIIFLALGVIWFLVGGLKSETKEDPFITPDGTTYGREEVATESFSWKNFFFPWLNNGTSTWFTAPTQAPSMTVNGIGVGSIPVQGVKVGSINTGGTNYTLYDPAKERVLDKYNNIEYNAPKSDLYGKIKIKRVNPRGTEAGLSAGNEKVYLYANKNNKKRINITGMVLKSPITLREGKIGQAVKVYYPNGGKQNYKEDIYLNPGDYVWVYTGKSPIRLSFQLNRCLAYIIPGLPSSCPTPLDYPLPTGASRFSDKCLDYLTTLSPCYDYSYNELPTNIEHECRVFIDEKTNYTKCVQDVGSKKGFLGNIWYVYLNRSQSLWKSHRDITELRDQNNKLIDIVSR